VEYLQAIEKIYPLLQMATSGLGLGKIKADVPEVPLLLEELERVERWGLPNPGTWLDQPTEYMADLEAARLGRDSYKPKQQLEQGMDQDSIFASAPPPKSVAG
jgi:hypothetical protein